MITTTSAAPQRRLPLLLVVILAAAVTAVLPAPARATPASPARPMIETGDFATGQVTNAISDGWWGHEGPAMDGTSVLSMGLADETGAVTDASVAATLARIGPDAAIDNIGVAFVLTSSDGSAEKPTVTAGQTAGQVFRWFSASTLTSGWNGTKFVGDYVAVLSTKAQYDAWYAAGQLPYGFDANLVPHDTTQAGSPVSVAPVGTSILNTWPAGTNVSLVYFVYSGFNAQNEPIVKVGPDGKAETAWMPFTTVALPTDHSRDPAPGFPASYDTVRTSAGYHVVDSTVAPTVALKDTWTKQSATGSLTATITNSAGTALTDATGTVQFLARAVNASSGAFTPVGAPVAVAADGTATIALTGLSPGDLQSYQATYTPDSAAQSRYQTATSARWDVLRPIETTTSLAVSGALTVGSTQTLTATIGASAQASQISGTVAFSDGSKTLGTATVASGKASLKAGLALGSHSLSATFTPTPSSGFFGSSATKSVSIAKAKATVKTALSPAKPKKGQRPKLTVTVTCDAVRPTGQVSAVVKPAKGRAVTVKASVNSKGVAVLNLPAAASGTTKLTVTYAGSATVASASVTLSYKVK